MRIIVCGDRNWTNRKSIYNALYGLPKQTIIIHGACTGADSIAGEIAKNLGLSVEEHPADWKIGRAAGPIRNREMLNSGTDLVIAFHNNIDISKGTKNMCKIARESGIPVILISEVE